MKKVLAFLLAVVMVLALSSCGTNSTTESGTTSPTVEKLNILGLKGPTGMGMAKLIADSKTDAANGKYSFSIIADPTMVASSLSTKSVDIAACPLNMASVIYNKLDGDIEILAINTLGSLYILDKTGTVNTLEDLKGKTIVTSGQGATPEYILKYLLDKTGLTGYVTVVFMSEHSEVVSALLSGKADIVMLPEPNVSVVTAKDSTVKIVADVAAEVEKSTGTKLAMGCIVARKDIIGDGKEINQFLEEYRNSIEYVNSSADAGKLIMDAGILDNAEIAQKAILNSAIKYIDGEEMKEIVEDNLNVLYKSNPTSIGGKMPNEDFFYIGQ